MLTRFAKYFRNRNRNRSVGRSLKSVIFGFSKWECIGAQNAHVARETNMPVDGTFQNEIRSRHSETT